MIISTIVDDSDSDDYGASFDNYEFDGHFDNGYHDYLQY